MSKVWKLSFTCNSLLLLTGFTLEATGFGLITRYRENAMYEFIKVTGLDWIYIFAYCVFFLFLPAINLIAILINPIKIRQV
jgi:hypothetical protein